MRFFYKRFILSIIIIPLVMALPYSCNNSQGKINEVIPSPKHTVSTLEQIKKKGKLVALTNFNSTDYFVYRGTPMGFQYELLKAFAEHMDVKLEIQISNNMQETFSKLQNQECDLVAKNLTVTKDRSKLVSFAQPHTITKQVLVQRIENGKEPIRNQIDLAGKTIYVQKGTSYAKRLQSLSDEIGDTIHVVQTERFGVEELIGMVAEGKIEYTACDEIVGLVNKRYYPNLDVETPVSFPQKLSWAVNKASHDLLAKIDDWITEYKKTREYQFLYAKYFRNPVSANIVGSEFYSLNGGKISIYDEVIKNQSRIINWDWRLLTSLIYTESRFNPRAKSWAGAYGLMQLMPETFTMFGADSTSAPEENIAAGVRLINWLNERFINDIPEFDERIKFILAAYNAGVGHVFDAQKLARKYGKDPHIWDNNVAVHMKNKTNPEFYLDPVVEYGYCRGDMVCIYVEEILERYQHYQKLIN